MKFHSLKFNKVTLLISALLLLCSIFLPYLVTIFTSPQYPDRSPVVNIYLDRIGGDIHEFQVVGRYIGLKIPPQLPEFDYKIILFLITLLALVTGISAFLGQKFRRIILILLIISGIGLAALAQYRMYETGHNLDPTAPMRYAIKPFTPPVVGIVKVHRITIYHLPHVGTLLYLGAILLTAYTVKRKTPLSKHQG